MAGITVGFDGSCSAYHALRWAMGEAAAHHAALTVLTVHPVAVSSWTGNLIVLPADQPALQKAGQAAEDAVRKVIAELGEPSSPSVTVHAVNGVAAEELISATAQADLVVVGSRGSSRSTRLLLGSVSSQVLHFAQCPVCVVPDERRRTGREV
jgi:nucleotide-binding universal stress UspA family protein